MKPITTRSSYAKNWLLSISALAAAISPTFADNYSDSVLADNPSIYYRFDTTGSTVTDEGSAGINGTTSGATQGVTSGPVPPTYNGFTSANKAVSFGGSDSVTFNTSSVASALNGSSQISVEMWLNPTSLGAASDSRGTLFSLPISSPYTQYAAGVVVNLEGNTGDIRMAGRSIPSDSFQKYVFSGTGISTSEWNYLVAIFDYANDELILYLNGELFGTSTGVDFGNSTLSIGSNTGSAIASSLGMTADGQNAYNGLLDEVAVYDYALSASDIESRYAVAVPEPSAYALGFASVVLFLAIMRRRRRS